LEATEKIILHLSKDHGYISVMDKRECLLFPGQSEMIKNVRCPIFDMLILGLPVDSFFEDLGYQLKEESPDDRELKEANANALRNLKMVDVEKEIANMQVDGEAGLTNSLLGDYDGDITLHELCKMLQSIGNAQGEEGRKARLDLSIILNLDSEMKRMTRNALGIAMNAGNAILTISMIQKAGRDMMDAELKLGPIGYMLAYIYKPREMFKLVV
jgi:hypothetical protein